jgi:hypothetical protein
MKINTIYANSLADLFSGLSQNGGGRKASDAAADDDGVQVFGDFVDVEALLDHQVPLLLVRDVGASRLPVILKVKRF